MDDLPNAEAKRITQLDGKAGRLFSIDSEKATRRETDLGARSFIGRNAGGQALLT